MRILIVTPKYYPDTFPINLISEALVKEGHEVDVLTSVPFKDGSYIDEYSSPKSLLNGVTVNRIKPYIRKNGKRSLVKNYLSIYHGFKKWAKINDKPYDVVYTYGISPVVSLVAGNIVKRKKNSIHVAHVLDIWPEAVVAAGYTKKGSLLYFLLKLWSKKEYKGASKILVGTKEYKDYLENVLKIKNKDISYLVQPGLIYEDESSENPYDIKKTNILYSGNISKLQLVDYIIPAMEKLNNENVVFNIIGSGSYLDEFRNLINEKKISNVIYHGYFDYKESAKYIKNADAVLVSLKNKGIVGKTIPNKLISSLYYSKVMIGMIEGEAKGILKENGNIIAEESIDGLVNGINEFIKLDKEIKLKIENKNRQLYDEVYSLDKFKEKLLSSFSRK